jgi:membrane associated rhomboid family serine protease
MLHADGVHLVGNMVGIALFGTAVCGIAGYGVGWLMILSTGILGNLLNAALMKAGHNSIGASTAIFGAIGILAGHQFYKRYRIPGKRVKAWLPLAGGLALLGLLGSGEHSDLTAHLFGFISGICLGILYALKFRRRQEKSVQRYCLFLLFGILFFSWLTAFSSA